MGATWLSRLLSLLLGTMVLSCPSMAQRLDDDLPRVVREREHSGQVVFVRPTSIGGPIVSVDYQGGVFLWDAHSLRQISTHRRAPFPVKTATLLDADTLLVVGSTPQDHVAAIDLRGNRPAKMLGQIGGEIQSLSVPFAQGAVRAVIGSDSWIRVREIDRDGSLRTILDLPRPSASAAAISADGRLVAVATQAKDLSLVEVDTGRALWTQTTDEVVTSLSLSFDAGVVLGGYDNVAASTLKRIDQFSLRTGKTKRRIPLEPCSVFQVDILDRDRGVAICGPAATDGLINLSKRIFPSIVTWYLNKDGEEPRVIPLPGTTPGYLPFRAGIAFDPSTGTLIASGGEGALVALKLRAGMPTKIERLAPAPIVVQRLAVSATSRKILAIARTTGQWGITKSRGGWPDTARTAIAQVLPPGGFTEEELNDGLNIEIAREGPQLRNGLTSWDANTGSREFAMPSDLGLILDVSGGVDNQLTSATIAEALTVSTSSPVESTVLAVTRIPSNDDNHPRQRRLLSINSSTGLLQEGIRRKDSDLFDFSRGICPSAFLPGNVRLSSDGQLLLVACLALRPGVRPVEEDVLRPQYDLLTYWLGDLQQHPPTRTRISGAPSHIELSRDGTFAAVLTTTYSMGDRAGQVTLDGEYALTVVDTERGKLVKTFAELPEPSLGKAIDFSADGKKAYVALGERVFRYSQGAEALVDLGLESSVPGPMSISAVALDESATLIAVARHNDTTEVYRLADRQPIANITHPGETMTQLCFDGGAIGRLVGTPASGGMVVFNYLQSERLADFLPYESGEWIAVTPEGTFSGSIGGELGVTVTDGHRAVAVDQLYDAYFRPDMLRRRLAGDRSALPSSGTIRRALSTPPPTVESQLNAASGDWTRLDITVKDAGGGIGGLRVFHNGKLAQDMSIDSLRQSSKRGNSLADREYRIRLDLPIASGPNDYAVTALNSDKSAQSRFTKVTVERPGSAGVAPMAYVLTIGTNTFEHAAFPNLSLAENSARRVGESFLNTMSSLVGHDNVVHMDLVGADSRYDLVERALQELEGKARADDIIAIVVTTHGKVLPSGELLAILRDTRPDYAGALAASRLIRAVNKIPALTQVLVLDICNAGVIPDKVAEIYQERFAVFAGSAGIHILASTSAEEPALAAYAGTTVFSHFLLKGLAAPQASKPAGRSLKRIAESVKRQVSEVAARLRFNQVPTIYSFGKDLLLP